jgi:hypothetical protein
VVVEERECEMRQQAEIENVSLAESLLNLTWMLLLNKGMLSHEPKGEKSKTHKMPFAFAPASGSHQVSKKSQNETKFIDTATWKPVASIFNKRFGNKDDSASVGYSNLFLKPIGALQI